MNTKLCSKCGEVKSLEEFGRNAARPSGVQTYCRSCTRAYRKTPEGKAKTAEAAKKWYQKNAERERERALARYYADPEPVRARRRKENMTPEQYASCKLAVTAYARRIKTEVFAHYGERCACCGEANPGFLTIDHINGCGRETRKEHGLGGSFYRWLKRNGFPEGFQTLCYNCNSGRAKNGGVCPHVLARQSTTQGEPF